MQTGGHIISAGGNIHTAYPAIFRELPSISSTCVFADSDVYALSSNPEIEKHRLAVRHAADAVKEISASLSIPFARETVFAPAYPSVRAILVKIHREHSRGPVHVRPFGRVNVPLRGTFCLCAMAWRGGLVRV